MATDPKPPSDPTLAPDAPDNIIPGHAYDGIREYDNPMPGWWTNLFWVTIVFSVIYLLGVHVFDFIDTYEEDLAQSMSELEAVRAAYAEANPSVEMDAAALAAFVGDPAEAKNGSEPYMTFCAACHGDQGQGLIGPNLTDAYWMHGGTDTDLYHIITAGVPDKGMPPWESTLSAEARAQLVAYIRSLAGTNPPGAKEPQGDLVE